RVQNPTDNRGSSQAEIDISVIMLKVSTRRDETRKPSVDLHDSLHISNPKDRIESSFQPMPINPFLKESRNQWRRTSGIPSAPNVGTGEASDPNSINDDL